MKPAPLFTPSGNLRGKLLAFAAPALLSAPAVIPSYGGELIASDNKGGDHYGTSTSLLGTTALAAAYGSEAASNPGAVYLFRDIDSVTKTKTEDLILTASDKRAFNRFGRSTSLSATTALIGSPARPSEGLNSSGAAYLFRGLDSGTGARTEDLILTASDKKTFSMFGQSVSLAGTTALVGASGHTSGGMNDSGAAYLFRGLDSGTGTRTEDLILTASDNKAGANFGDSGSLWGSTALVGAPANFSAQPLMGAAYFFRGLDSGTGTRTEDLILTASDNKVNDYFGQSVSLSGTTALVGAYRHASGGVVNAGAAYLFRGLDSGTGTRTEDLILTTSNALSFKDFGYSGSLSGTTALIGAHGALPNGSSSNTGAVFLFRNLDSGTGARSEDLILTASAKNDGGSFGYSVALDGDRLVIGTPSGGISGSGTVYTGSVSGMTTLDTGGASMTISGISFTSRGDWIVGQTTDQNSVTLSAGDTASVTGAGKVVRIGQTTASDGNTLSIQGNLTAASILVGAGTNTGNHLLIGRTGLVTSGVTVNANSSIGGGGILTGGLMFGEGAKLYFDSAMTLTVNGTVTFGNAASFGVDDLISLDSGTAPGTYTLIASGTNFEAAGLANWGMENAYDLGGGKQAYFQKGGLQLVVVPEPSALILLSLTAAPLMRRKRGGPRAGQRIK